MRTLNRHRIWLVLAAAGLIILFLATAPGMGAAAATGNITLSASEGPVGGAIGITVNGFTPGAVYTVRFAAVAILSGTTDTAGDFSDEFIVPSQPGGRYSVTVTTAVDSSNAEYFTVTPEITLDSQTGRSGGQVKISGTGFKASSSVSILFDTISVGTITSNTGGSFANTVVTIPAGSQGKYTVTAKDSLRTSPGVTFNVQRPEISLSNDSGRAGDPVTVIGSGFNPGSSVTILFDAVGVGTVTTDSSGSFSGASVTVPAGLRGKSSVTGKDSLGTSPGVAFNIDPPVISLGQSSGYAGDPLSVSGSGFKPDSSITVYFDTTGIGSFTTGAAGSFSDASVNVPSAYRGKHTVTVKDSLGSSLGAEFDIMPGATARVVSKAAASSIEVNGSGFTANSKISIDFDGAALAAITSGVAGEFTASAQVPETPAGNHSIQVRDSGGNTASTIVSVSPVLAISPTGGPSGTVVNLNGTGFSAGGFITIKFNGVAVPTNPIIVQSGSRGSFSAGFEIPPCLPGSYTIEASDVAYSAAARFDSVLAATISQSTSAVTPGHVGMELSISGVGFKPNAKVIVTRATIQEELATAETDANGIFTIDFVIPPSPGGEHNIIVTDGVNVREFDFFIEQEAPPAPVPLSPDADKKPRQPALFDWKDVSDESGVTYTIQIARDKLFASVVAEQEGLSDSEYILPEGELESVTKENPYYWRLKAVDGAYNESEWSEGRAFSLGFILTLPNGEPELTLSAWMVYGLIALIALFIFIGFLAGRRTARE